MLEIPRNLRVACLGAGDVVLVIRKYVGRNPVNTTSGGLRWVRINAGGGGINEVIR